MVREKATARILPANRGSHKFAFVSSGRSLLQETLDQCGDFVLSSSATSTFDRAFQMNPSFSVGSASPNNCE